MRINTQGNPCSHYKKWVCIVSKMFMLKVENICVSAITKNLGLGCDSWPCSANHIPITVPSVVPESIQMQKDLHLQRRFFAISRLGIIDEMAFVRVSSSEQKKKHTSVHVQSA